jgi:branched-subunit amino acid permease
VRPRRQAGVVARPLNFTVRAQVRMSRRQYILLGIMALGFVAMAWFVAWDNGIPMTQMVGYCLAGVLLVAVAVISLMKERTGALGLSGWIKVVFGSYALAFAIWMLGSVVLLPLVGYAGFEVLNRPWFGVALLALAVLVFPIVRRYMR